jgi:hypothetical protein
VSVVSRKQTAALGKLLHFRPVLLLALGCLPLALVLLPLAGLLIVADGLIMRRR